MDSSADEEQIQSIHKMIKKGRKNIDLPIEPKKTAQPNKTRKRKLNIIQQPEQSKIVVSTLEETPHKTKKKSPEEKVSKEKKPRKTKKKSPEEKVSKEKKLKEKNPPKIRKTKKTVKLVNIAPRLVIEEENLDKPEINIETDELPELVPILHLDKKENITISIVEPNKSPKNKTTPNNAKIVK